MVEDAELNLLLTLVVALLMLLGSAAFWRLSLRADASQALLMEERHLATLGEMSAVLAHELRNPLTSLKGNAQLMSERFEVGTRDRRRADRIVKEALRLEKLIGDLLDFVRSGRIFPQEISPLDLAQDVAEMLQISTLEIRDEGAPRTWAMDPDRVHQVLVNLLDNARKVAGEVPIILSVGMHKGDLRYVVRDHGPGLPEGAAETLFEPFHTGRSQGVGLGLAVVSRIAAAHGGSVTAANAPDGGAAFTVTIPDNSGKPGASDPRTDPA